MAEKVSRRMKRVACVSPVLEMRGEERFVQYHRAIQELMDVESSRQDDASSLGSFEPVSHD